MFYEVRVFDVRKNLRKIISRQELSRKYWKEFEEKQKGIASKQRQNNSSVNSKHL